MVTHLRNVLLCLSELQILILVLAILLFYYLTKRDGRHVKLLKGLPEPPSLPWIGSALAFLIRDHHEYPGLVTSWFKSFGSLFVVWIGNIPIVVCCGAKEVETVLSSSTQVTKSKEYDLLHKWFGNGLLTANAERWQAMRKKLTPSFHYKTLEGFIPVFNEQGDVLVNILKREGTLDGQCIDVFPYITRCTLDIICETAMGVKLNSQGMDTEHQEYIDALDEYCGMMLLRFFRPWFQIEALWKLSGYGAVEERYIKTIHTFTTKMIADRQRARKLCGRQGEGETDGENLKKRKAFLDLLLDLAEEHNLSDKIIREETDTLMFGGHDSTATSMVWTIMNLSHYPEHQKLVQEELDEILEGAKDVEITASHVLRMKYLESCIKETLRLYAIPFQTRQFTEDTRIGKQVIPKGVTVAVANYVLHRDPHTFPDPELFNPQRFLGQEKRDPYAYIPFSAGPRNCIGQKFAMLEDKIVLAKLLMNFNFKLAEKFEDIKKVPHITLRPMNGVKVSITPRR